MALMIQFQVFALWCVFVLAASGTASAATDYCKFSDGSESYDVTSIQPPAKGYFELPRTTINNWLIGAALCDALPTDLGLPGAVALQYWGVNSEPTCTNNSPDCASMGSQSTGKASSRKTYKSFPTNSTGFVIDFTGGTPTNSGNQRSITYVMICDAERTQEPKIEFHTENPALHYILYWYHARACASSSGPPSGCTYQGQWLFDSQHLKMLFNFNDDGSFSYVTSSSNSVNATCYAVVKGTFNQTTTEKDSVYLTLNVVGENKYCGGYQLTPTTSVQIDFKYLFTNGCLKSEFTVNGGNPQTFEKNDTFTLRRRH